MKPEAIVGRADELLAHAERVAKTTGRNEWGSWVDQGSFAGFRAAVLSFLGRTFGVNHAYYQNVSAITHNTPADFSSVKEILLAAKAEIEGGWMQSVRALVAADLFADFLEMGRYLCKEGYKDAAAVMVGSVLESHLRQLAIANDVPVSAEREGDIIPFKADRVNAELAKAEIYTKLDQKAVTAWLDLRNKAAHGEYDQYTKEQVELMQSGLTDFMARLPLS